MSAPTLHYYWRPGCPFCMMLTPKIRSLDIEVEEHNIWEDDEAAAAVRAAADGNETVPTVIIGEHVLVNPNFKAVQAAIAAEDPTAEPPKPSLWQRVRGS